MLTLTLQNLRTVLLLAFAVYAWRASRTLAPGDQQRPGWTVTAAVFLIYAGNKALQDVLATWAYFAGPGTASYTVYLRVAPIADHSRTLLMFALYALLLALPLRERLGGRARVLAGVVIGAALAGGMLLGWFEGPFQASRHLTLTARIDTFGFIVLGVTLLLAMFNGSMDRLLWFSVAAYGFTSVLGVLFLSLIAWVGQLEWTPPAWSMQVMRCVFAAIMLGLSFWRFRSARTGRPVRLMLEPMRTPLMSLR
ncbi:MAG TPA: hypothetical protein VFJ82_16345 [Longimicrobium sp.]|nr:hypothetical protein [Longimicrobium sp.]